MNMRNFSKRNLERCTATNGFNHPLAAWSVAEWTNAVAGEAGEACNISKKLLRFRDVLRGNVKAEDQDEAALRIKLLKELADVIIYADLAIQSLGGDTSDVVQATWNGKSAEIGFPGRVGT